MTQRDGRYDPNFLDSLSEYIDGTTADQQRIPPNNLVSVADQAGRSDEKPKSFNDTWSAITRFAESESVVSKLSHGNDNEICVGNDGVRVRNLDTEVWREIDKGDFRVGFEGVRWALRPRVRRNETPSTGLLKAPVGNQRTRRGRKLLSLIIRNTLEDTFLTADSERHHQQAEVLSELADAGWQTIYLTAKREAERTIREVTGAEFSEFDPLR